MENDIAQTEGIDKQGIAAEEITPVEEIFELNDQETVNYINEQRGTSYETLEEVLAQKEKIIEREVNPYEDVIEDDDKAYYKYKRETGRSRKEYEALNTDLSTIPKIELARERVRKESGSGYSNEQIDAYLSDTLGIDLEDMSDSDQIKLASFTKSVLDEKRVEQEKYKKPVEKSTENEYVKLDNGSIMLKQDFEKLELQYADFEKNRLANIQIAKEAVNSVTAFDFDFQSDENGTLKQEKFTFELPDTDKQRLLSNVSDMRSAIDRVFGSDKNVNHIKLQKALYFAENEGKLLTSFKNKVEAEVTERVLKQRGNVNFTSNDPLQQQNREGVKMMSFKDILKEI
ncbi:MAG: Cellulophaga phage phi19:3 [Bacteroidota bacterium]|jgi:hypothetical protein